MGPHQTDPGLHQPHAPARGAGEMAAPLVRGTACRAIWRSSFEINRRLLDEVRSASRATRAASNRISLVEEGAAAQDSHGQPGDRRLAQHQRRRRNPFRPAAHGDGQGSGRDVPRALQQQDQRRDATPLASAGQPCSCRQPSPQPSATAGSPILPNWQSSKPLADDEAFATPSARPSATPSRSLRDGSDRHRA